MSLETYTRMLMDVSPEFPMHFLKIYMNDSVVGIGIDLTQHVPLVSAAVCPEAIRADRSVDAASLARHWPPEVELYGPFRPQLPSAVLPLMPGEPLLVGDAAAAHRRSAGLVWPPEAQVPYAGDPACGVGRIPLVAAWAALLPLPGADEGLARRDDPEFKWCPEGREHTARAGQILAASIKAFLKAAGISLHSLLTAIVVPDALDEAGQQILLDNLAHVGVSPDRVHLLPRPLAVALHWCHTADTPPVGQVTEDEEGTVVGRLRIVTMALDVWEAISLELRARRYGGRVWVVPVRDRAQLTGAPPELQMLGLNFALALACTDTNGEPLEWWPRVFANDWLEKRLTTNRDLSPEELDAIREVCSQNSPASWRQEFRQLSTLQPLWSRFFQSGPASRDAIGQRWENQERSLGISALPCMAVLADGAFARLRVDRGLTVTPIELPQTPKSAIQVFSLGQSAVSGAALAATAIAHRLPCYRETLLPLDLYVLGKDENSDLAPQWKELVVAKSVEAGRLWHSPTPVTGLQIRESQDRLLLPLRREVRHHPMFRKVGTELATPATCDESVRVEVEVKPGQGFARVRVESVTPGMFATRLDWSTMEECTEPEKPKLSYPTGVVRVVPDKALFERARGTLEATRKSLESWNSDVEENLVRLTSRLKQYRSPWIISTQNPLPTLGSGNNVTILLGVLGSDGRLNESPDPDLVHALRRILGRRFHEVVVAGKQNSLLGQRLLRAAGWFYLAIPDECRSYLQKRLSPPQNSRTLKLAELNSIGLALEAPEDLERFYPLLQRRLSGEIRVYHWFRAARDIWRFRNHSLSPHVIARADLDYIVSLLRMNLQTLTESQSLSKALTACLEATGFSLKRRRYEMDFMDPDVGEGRELVELLEAIERRHAQALRPKVIALLQSTINFLRSEANESDLINLLSVEDEDSENDEND